MAGIVALSTKSDNNKGYAILDAAWVADADAATIPDTALPNDFIEAIKGWYLYAIQTKPGAGDVAPTADYNVTLEDSIGMDILGGAGADRSASATEWAMPLWGTETIPAPVVEGLTLKVAGNSVVSAEGQIRLIFVRGMLK